MSRCTCRFELYTDYRNTLIHFLLCGIFLFHHQSLESGLVQKQKERDEKIVAAQKAKQESDEKKQLALKEQYDRKIKASEELLAQQSQKLSEKNAAKAKKQEEARKQHDETVAAKIKDAEQKLAKISVSILCSTSWAVKGAPFEQHSFFTVTSIY